MILRLYEKKVINKMIYYRNTKRLSPILERDGIRVMAEKITIQKDDVMNAYKQASVEQRVFLENIFGKEVFIPEDIRERVKTFDDAVVILGNDNQAVIDYFAISDANCSDDILAYAKLRVITEALNEGWNPTFDEDEYRFYVWFYICTKAEYDRLNKDKKEECRIVGRSSAGGGFAYAPPYCSSSGSHTGFGSRLAFKTRELAEYCGKQFIDIWADFLFS